MGLFKNLSTQQPRRDFVHEYTAPGAYLQRIDEVKLFKVYTDGSGRDTRTRKGFEQVVISKTVIAVLPSTEPPPQHLVGTEVSHLIKVTGNDRAGKDFNQFILTVLGLDKAEMLDDPAVKALAGGMDWEDWVGNDDAVRGPVQPLRGVVVQMNNRLNLGKKKLPTDADKYFCNVHYTRQVPWAEVLQSLKASDPSGELVNRFFPNNFLQNKIAEEAAAK